MELPAINENDTSQTSITLRWDNLLDINNGGDEIEDYYI